MDVDLTHPMQKMTRDAVVLASIEIPDPATTRDSVMDNENFPDRTTNMQRDESELDKMKSNCFNKSTVKEACADQACVAGTNAAEKGSSNQIVHSVVSLGSSSTSLVSLMASAPSLKNTDRIHSAEMAHATKNSVKFIHSKREEIRCQASEIIALSVQELHEGQDRDAATEMPKPQLHHADEKNHQQKRERLKSSSRGTSQEGRYSIIYRNRFYSSYYDTKIAEVQLQCSSFCKSDQKSPR